MKKPTKIYLEDVCMSTSFSPVDATLAAGDIAGTVSFHKNATKTLSIKVHEGSCRSVDFNMDGAGLFTVGIDKSLQMVHLEMEKVVLKKQKAHNDSINIVKCLDENLIATGDDQGCVKIWDIRTRKIAKKWHENSDFISDMLYVPEKNTLLATGGDGCLTVLDPRKDKPIAVSDNQDDDLLSIATVKVLKSNNQERI
jgi:WD repeat-containing protein 55